MAKKPAKKTKKKKQIVIFGGSGHARVLFDAAVALGFDVKAIVVPTPNSVEQAPVKVISETDWEKTKIQAGIVGIGDNWTRHKVVEKILSLFPKFEFVSLVHPSAVQSPHATVGAGTIVMPGATINIGARIGSHCIINTNASLDHDCIIDDFASVAPGATLGGNVTVGRYSAVGLGANIVQGIQIGDACVVGAGAVVIRDLPDSVVAYGNPCRVVRGRKTDEPYLKKK